MWSRFSVFWVLYVALHPAQPAVACLEWGTTEMEVIWHSVWNADMPWVMPQDLCTAGVHLVREIGNVLLLSTKTVFYSAFVDHHGYHTHDFMCSIPFKMLWYAFTINWSYKWPKRHQSESPLGCGASSVPCQPAHRLWVGGQVASTANRRQEFWVTWEAVLGIRPKMDHFRWR